MSQKLPLPAFYAVLKQRHPRPAPFSFTQPPTAEERREAMAYSHAAELHGRAVELLHAIDRKPNAITSHPKAANILAALAEEITRRLEGGEPYAYHANRFLSSGGTLQELLNHE